MDPQELVVILLVFGGGAYVVSPIVRAIAKRIAGEVPARRQESDLSESVLAELQDLRGEVSALAERVDFTERLLARQRDAERLAGPRREEGL